MNLSVLHARCGDLREARKLLIEARSHHRILDDRRALAASLINESFVAIWQRDARSAHALAQEGVAIATEMDHAAYVASGLANLGAAERDLGRNDEAIAHMERGLALQLSLNRMADGVSDLADIAWAYLQRGDLAQALLFADRVLELGLSATETAIFPPYPWWVVARILHAAGDDRHLQIQEQAWERAQLQAGSITDAGLRACFETLPFFGEMRLVAGGGPWPSITSHTRANAQVHVDGTPA